MSPNAQSPMIPNSFGPYFKAPAEMKVKQLEFLVDNILTPGITVWGGPSGHGKSWLALSLAKALVRGEPFLGHFPVKQSRHVIYLVPEVGEGAFSTRLNKMRISDISDERFLCRTLSDGLTTLHDPQLLTAVKQLKPVVFLDTLIRFNPNADENDAAQSAKLANAVFNLLLCGAAAVVPLHHSIKSLANGQLEPTLENTLRGSGDIGAMADAVYCVLCSDTKNFRSEVTCVKARDFEMGDSFIVEGRPHINEIGNLALIKTPEMDIEQLDDEDLRKVCQAIENNPKSSQNKLAKECRVRKSRIVVLASKGGWVRPNNGNGCWIRKS